MKKREELFTVIREQDLVQQEILVKSIGKRLNTYVVLLMKGLSLLNL